MPHTNDKPKSAQMIVFDFTTDVATGDGKFYFDVPSNVNNLVLSSARGRVVTAGTTGSTDIQIHNVTGAVDMLSGKIQIASGSTSASGTIDLANNSVATNDLLRVDVDAVSTTAPKGLIVTIQFDEV